MGWTSCSNGQQGKQQGAGQAPCRSGSCRDKEGAPNTLLRSKQSEGPCSPSHNCTETWAALQELAAAWVGMSETKGWGSGINKASTSLHCCVLTSSVIRKRNEKALFWIELNEDLDHVSLIVQLATNLLKLGSKDPIMPGKQCWEVEMQNNTNKFPSFQRWKRNTEG